MQETEYELLIYRSAVVGPNGVATILAVGPDQPFERWVIKSTQISNNGASRTKCEIFNNMSMTQLVEGSYSGNLDTSDTVFDLPTSQNLHYRWSNGSVGSTSTLTLRGRKFVKGNRGGGL